MFKPNRRAVIPILGVCLAWAALATAADLPQVHALIHARPLHAGRIDPKLFGNFVELLDDVVPGMWAELLNDRSFEGVIPAANWCYYDGSPDICDRPWDTNASWRCDSENAFNGARSARLDATGQLASLTQSGLGVQKDMTYAFSGYLRGTPGTRATVLLKSLLPTGDWLVLASADLPELTSEWRRYSARLATRGATDRAVFELQCHTPGVLWADKLSLMPEDNLGGWRREVVQAVEEVHPTLIRWGGSSIDPGHYRWKAGIGDRDLRTPWRNENWGRLDSNDVGIDEFCQFCEFTKVEPLICVSFADGPQNAGDLVEYCNGASTTPWGARRAVNGHPAPYRVKYWQVGNEIAGDNPQYLAQFGEFAAAMKHADPALLLMSSFPSQRLLDRAGKDIAYVCPHHYTTDFAACDRDLDNLAAMLDHSPGCDQIKVAVTEWNIDGGSWGLGRGKQMTLEAALLNARYLNLLMRHSDKVRIACRSNLANSYCGAIFETGISGLGILRRPSFYVMKLYALHARPVPLRLEPSSDRLDLFACGSEDKTSAVVFAVNLKPEPAGLNIEFDGFGHAAFVKAAEALGDTLEAGQPDVMNHWQTPQRVTILPVPVSAHDVRIPGLSAVAVECDTR